MNHPDCFETYTAILRNEIMPAIGCTEPISVACCAAKAQQVLAMQPTAVTVSVSENTLKNVKGVIVPNTNGLKGIRAAVSAGVVCGNADKGMQVLENVTEEQREAITRFMETTPIDVSCAETECALYISVTLYARTSYSRVVIANGYSNVVEIMKNGEALFKQPIVVQSEDHRIGETDLNVRGILEYAQNADLNEIRDQLDLQIGCNTAICEEGFATDYGANIGKILLSADSPDAKTIAKAYAAAGTDARMNGCDLPAAILCGSGNQGIAASVPILCYAKQYAIPQERTYRALILSDLLTVYLNVLSGKRSAVCGAANAGCAAGAGVAFLLEENESAVVRTLLNALNMISETVCDGAAPACAARIAEAIDTGILGYQMYLYRKHNQPGEDLPEPNVDEIIRSLVRHSSDGLSEPDQAISSMIRQS